MNRETEHIIHDVDRDGWGSAALLCAELGPSRCRLHPTAGKDALALIGRIDVQPGDRIWLLDIALPNTDFDKVKLPGVPITWVDHHPVHCADFLPRKARLLLPTKPGRTTTMHLLIEHDLVPSLVNPMEFVRSMCVPRFETRWVRVLDGLAATWDSWPIAHHELPEVLAAAARAKPVPEALAHLEQRAARLHEQVDEILDSAAVRRGERVVVVRLADAHGIPLKHFCLRAQQRFERPNCVLVHRERRIYCGISAKGGARLDLLEHFAARGLTAKGHPYVAVADVLGSRIDDEVEALRGALEGPVRRRNSAHEHLEKVIGWAERLRDTLMRVEKEQALPVWLRPSSGGVAVIGLTQQNPQRGRSGYRDINRLERDLERIFARHCIDLPQRRPTPEKGMQSRLILDALRNGRRLVPFENAAGRAGTTLEVCFMVDEIPLPAAKGRMTCDLLAVRKVPDGYVPVVIELKSSRRMKRLVEQVTDYAAAVDQYADLFERLFRSMSPFPVTIDGPCEKWIAWPRSKGDYDHHEELLAEQNIHVFGYEPGVFDGAFSSYHRGLSEEELEYERWYESDDVDDETFIQRELIEIIEYDRSEGIDHAPARAAPSRDDDARLNAMLPVFAYHPNPISTGMIAPSSERCGCCGEARGFAYCSEIFCAEEVASLCPWCIADGSAARKYGVRFVDTFRAPGMKRSIDIDGRRGRTSRLRGVPPGVIEELCRRTPGYSSWQDATWIMCCNDACEFHGDISRAELLSLPADVLYEMLPGDREELMEFVECYQPDECSFSIFKFKCRHCGRIALYLDLC